MKRLKPKSEFSRNVLTLMTGTTIAQAIPIAISPILTRIYTPEDFGVYAIFMAIVLIFGSIASASYELAIMLPKKDEDAINIFALSFIITTGLSLLLLILVVLFNNNFTSLLNNDEIGFWLYFVPIVVFFSGLFNILKYFNNRKKNYKDIANATIIKSIILAITQLSIGFVKNGVAGLISGQILSQFFANIRLLKNIIKDKTLISKIKKIKIIALAKRYRNFPKFTMWSGLLNTTSLQIPTMMLSVFFNSTIVGFYSLSHRFISMPMALIGSSIGQVFYQQSSNIKNDKEALKKLTLRTYKKLFKIGIIPFSIIIVFGDYIFSFVFGEAWRVAGEYAQLLGVWILFLFIHSPLTSLFLTLEKQKEGLYFNIIILSSRIIVLFIGGYILQESYYTIMMYSFTGVIINLFILFYFFKLLNIDILREMIYIFSSLFAVSGSLYIIKILLVG